MNTEILNHVINLEVERLTKVIQKKERDNIIKEEGVYYLIGTLTASIEITIQNLNHLIKFYEIESNKK
jgi:hypothetical protein